MAKANLLNIAKRCIQLNCPRCGEAKVFIHQPDKFISFPEMNKQCPKCQYKFDREPGYFLGAMFVSYALAVAEGLVTFGFLKIMFSQLEYFTIACIITVVILLCSITNYKLARVIWINLFP